jgi:outer membrane protein TolC
MSTIHASLTLKQCIERALENNPVIEYKNWKIKEVNAQIKKAASQRWPSLHGVGSYYHFSDTQRLAVPRRQDYPLIFTDDMLSWSLVMTIPLFTGGRITNEIVASELSRRSAEHSLDYTRQELIFKVTSVYFSILKQHKIVESLDFSRTTLERHLQRVKELIAAKKAAELDVLRIEVRLANIMQKMEQENNILTIHNRSLANLMGLKEIDFNIPPQSEIQFEETEMDLEENLNMAYSNRADYHSVLKEVEAQAKRVKAAHAAYWPSLSLYASYGAKQAVGSFIQPPGMDGIEDIGQFGFFFDFPFFEGGKTKAIVAQEQARLASLKGRQRELELAIRLDVEAAILNLVSTRKRILAIEKAIEQASESLRIELEKYDLGKGSLTDIFDAESALLEVQTIYYVALADYNIYSAQLNFVQGIL